MKQPDRKSPLRQKLLRIPGESIQAEIERLWIDELIPWILAVAFTGLLAVIEWIHWLTKSPPSPWLYSALAVIAIGYSLWRLRKARVHMRQLTLGLRGERAVAEILDALREKGAKVFHDVPGEGFNVDHVVVSDRGIYAIETKTVTKARGASVSFDPEGQILVDGRRLDRDPVAQSKAAARWLASTLKASTGKTFPVRPVVLFPGWWIEPMKSPHAPDVWVLEPKALPRWIENEPLRILEPDLSLAKFHLDLYVRNAGPDAG